jgi:hypothetical protein
VTRPGSGRPSYLHAALRFRAFLLLRPGWRQFQSHIENSEGNLRQFLRRSASAIGSGKKLSFVLLWGRTETSSRGEICNRIGSRSGMSWGQRCQYSDGKSNVVTERSASVMIQSFSASMT